MSICILKGSGSNLRVTENLGQNGFVAVWVLQGTGHPIFALASSSEWTTRPPSWCSQLLVVVNVQRVLSSRTVVWGQFSITFWSLFFSRSSTILLRKGPLRILLNLLALTSQALWHRGFKFHFTHYCYFKRGWTDADIFHSQFISSRPSEWGVGILWASLCLLGDMQETLINVHQEICNVHQEICKRPWQRIQTVPSHASEIPGMPQLTHVGPYTGLYWAYTGLPMPQKYLACPSWPLSHGSKPSISLACYSITTMSCYLIRTTR